MTAGGTGLARAWAALGLAWLLGCALQLQMSALWPAWWLWLLLSKAAVLALVAWRWRQSTAGLLLLSLAALALGFASTHGRASWRLADALPPSLEGQDLVLTGRVASLPREGPDGVRFNFAVDSAQLRGQPVAVPPLLSLGWYRGFDEDTVLGGPAQAVRAGQQWRLTARLRQPHGAFNPHGFDLELWLFDQGVRATGYVRSRPGDEAVLLAAQAGHRIEAARQDWRAAINSRVSDPAAAGVLAALAVGDQAAIERADWDTFRSTGVAHLMAISGLHVTMFAWLAGLLIGRLWRLQPRLLLACPAPTAARWGGLLAAVGYALLAGWGVPAQRTVWMIAAVVLLRQAGVRWPLPAVLLAAAVVVTVIDPWALLQPGFWLSFVAVALLVVSEPVQASSPRDLSRLQRAWATVRGGVGTQAVATAGLAPLSLLFFQQISLVGFAANLVAIPVVTLLITPLALLGLLLPPLWGLAAWLVQMLTLLLQVLAGLPLAVWQAAAAPPWAVACGLLAGALAVLPLPWRLRALALPLMLPLLAPAVARPPPGSFEAVVVDVGQGTAVLVRTHGHLLVYDTGPVYSRETDAGVRVLLPLLQARGERQIDHLMLSHRDTDHVGGAATLMRALPVRALSSSLEAGHPLLTHLSRGAATA
ncbi:MAG: DNA internalization-related competence protein ComEC/Rec2, partial [Rubrivivax sp.]|nr:DNA internalization-related competence protein ComEC/Rec2 [Rubrivivax sp.]